MIKLFKRGKTLLEQRHLWNVFTYVFFGGLATVVNIIAFAGVMHAGVNWQVANFLAWLLSILFAFVTNKLWVFNSHTESFVALVWEFTKFIIARIASLGIDYTCMFLFIDTMRWSNILAKVLTQIVIVIANYAFSKFVIFRNTPNAN